jgi:AraC-like DNA-binding protein
MDAARARLTDLMPNQGIFYAVEGPLDTLPGEGQLRAANLQGFSEYARRRNADPHRILERFGIEPRTLNDPDAHVSAQALVAMFEYCREIFDDRLFGLHLAQHQVPEVFGCITTLCRAAPDMRTALAALTEYVPILHSPEAAPELHVTGDVAELRWNVLHDLGTNDQADLQALVLQLKLLEKLGFPHFKPLYVQLTIDPHPADVPAIEAAIGCPLHIGASINAIAFPAELLDRPVPTANRLVYRLLGGYLDRVKQANRATLVERVRDYVRGDLPRGTCSIERCADKLGLSVRTLQARLAADHVTFSWVMEDTRILLAKSYLRLRDRSLDEIAEWLGYGEQTSFGRAFKRWTGTTPQKYRANL